MLTIKRALISVSNKDGVVAFARMLRRFRVEIISTGGTLALLKKNRIPVTSVDEITGYHEILDGMVKTFHPTIHAGLLYPCCRICHWDLCLLLTCRTGTHPYDPCPCRGRNRDRRHAWRESPRNNRGRRVVLLSRHPACAIPGPYNTCRDYRN